MKRVESARRLEARAVRGERRARLRESLANLVRGRRDPFNRRQSALGACARSIHAAATADVPTRPPALCSARRARGGKKFLPAALRLPHERHLDALTGRRRPAPAAAAPERVRRMLRVLRHYLPLRRALLVFSETALLGGV